MCTEWRLALLQGGKNLHPRLSTHDLCMTMTSYTYKSAVIFVLGFVALFQVTAGQGTVQPKIITTFPIVVPCAQCLQSCGYLPLNFFVAPSSLYSAIPPQLAPVSNSIVQPPLTQPAFTCNCATNNWGVPPPSPRPTPTVDAQLLAAPIASFLAGLVSGLRQDQITVQFEGGDICNCSVPASEAAASPSSTRSSNDSSSAAPSLAVLSSNVPSTDVPVPADPDCCPPVPPDIACNTTETRLAFGWCGSPAEAATATADGEEDELPVLAINQDITENQCPAPPVITARNQCPTPPVITVRNQCPVLPVITAQNQLPCSKNERCSYYCDYCKNLGNPNSYWPDSESAPSECRCHNKNFYRKDFMSKNCGCSLPPPKSLYGCNIPNLLPCCCC